MANVTEELKFLFYSILISVDLNVKSYMWLVAFVVDRTPPDRLTCCNEVTKVLLYWVTYCRNKEIPKVPQSLSVFEL